jgi:hypothetical protein
MKILYTLIILLASFMVVAENEISVTGTYSSLGYNNRSGDLNGMELKIVFSFEGHYGVLQCGSGVPTVVPLVVDGNKIYFKLTESNEDALCGFGSDYEGAISKRGIGIKRKGKNGSFNHLPRQESYWENRDRIL